MLHKQRIIISINISPTPDTMVILGRWSFISENLGIALQFNLISDSSISFTQDTIIMLPRFGWQGFLSENGVEHMKVKFCVVQMPLF
jgi:hypothetical protein